MSAATARTIAPRVPNTPTRYAVDPQEVEQAAALRAQAMVASDRWVERGCDPDDPLLAEERSLLVRSYAALLAAVHR